MPSQHKIEIFGRDYTFRDKAVFGDAPFSFDYLTLENTELQLPKIKAEKGDYAYITDFNNNVVYQGIVSDASFNKYTTTLKLAPLLSLFDVTVSVDKAYLETGSLEGFIGKIITDYFISNADSAQNIDGLSVTVSTNTTGVTLDISKSIAELYDIITNALSSYGIVVSAVLVPQEQELNVTIGKGSATPTVIETTLLNAIDKNFVIGDSFGAVNKLTLINQNDETEQAIYYLHSDGTVSDVDEDRVTPVFLKTEYINNSDFETAAESRAKKVLTPQQFNNQIELTYSRGDKLIDADSIAIGTLAEIIDGDDTYSSILTGYEKTEDLITLIFGVVREDLTKKLMLDRRRQGVPAYASADQGVLADSIAKGVSCKGYNDDAQPIPNETDTVLELPKEYFDTEDMHDLVTNNSRITIKTAGKYAVGAQIAFAANPTGLRVLGVRLNGTTYVVKKQITAAQAGRTIMPISGCHIFAEDDYIELVCYQARGSALNTDVTDLPTSLWAYKVSN